MIDTLTRWLGGLSNRGDADKLRQVLLPMADRTSTQCLASAALRIKGGSASPTVQTNAVSHYCVQGVLVKIASGTDLTALSGTVTNAKFNAFVHFVDSAGTVTVAMGTEGATRAAVVLPPFPQGKAVIGITLVNPTGTGNFVGGTTNLDDATVAPNVEFINVVGDFDPTVLV